jgi:hypothetical protein
MIVSRLPVFEQYIGIDHAFSFPLRYFEAYHLPPDWPGFLDDFQKHWHTDDDNTYVDFVRDGLCGDGAARSGRSRWRRLTDERAGAKSVFHFDVPGSVAKSTHAGLPWLRYMRQQLGDRVHFWPFDGWELPAGRSVIFPSPMDRASQRPFILRFAAQMALTPVDAADGGRAWPNPARKRMLGILCECPLDRLRPIG